MNAEEEGLSVNERLDLVIQDGTVNRMMGPEPIPSLGIEMSEIWKGRLGNGCEDCWEDVWCIVLGYISFLLYDRGFPKEI